MPPKNKMTTKICPDCDSPCAVACKTCTCGYSFYHSRRSEGSATASSSNAADQPEQDETRQRRTQRVKERPNYYDAAQFIKVKRKRRRRNEDQYELRRGSEPPNAGALNKGRKKKKGGRGAPKEEEEEEEVLPIGISPTRTAQCAVILADLNRRIQSTAVRIR